MAKINGKDVPKAEKDALLKTQATIHGESFYHYKLIAKAVGIDEDTLRKFRETDAEFSAELEQARSRFLSKRIRQARPEFLLERLEPEIFKQRTESDVRVELPRPILGGSSKAEEDGLHSDDSN